MTNHEWQLWRNHRRPFICARLAAYVVSLLHLLLIGLISFLMYEVGQVALREVYGRNTDLFAIMFYGFAAMYLLLSLLVLSGLGLTYGLWKLKVWAWWLAMCSSSAGLLVLLAHRPWVWWQQITLALLVAEIIFLLQAIPLFRDRTSTSVV